MLPINHFKEIIEPFKAQIFLKCPCICMYLFYMQLIYKVEKSSFLSMSPLFIKCASFEKVPHIRQDRSLTSPKTETRKAVQIDLPYNFLSIQL